MNTFGARLRDARLTRDLSQGALAELGGVTRNTQHLYESDTRVPDANYLMRLAEGGFDVALLLTGKLSPSLDENETALLRAFRLLEASRQDALLVLLCGRSPFGVREEQRLYLSEDVEPYGASDSQHLDPSRPDKPGG